MEYKILFYFYIMLIIGVLAKDTRIMGGSDASVREFPYIVSIRRMYDNMIFCSGVIISQKHILTSAQCTTIYKESNDLILIYTSTTPSISQNGLALQIDTFIIHPEFQIRDIIEFVFSNDISIIKVVETIDFNEFQNKIDLPTENILYGVDCTMASWGSVSYPQATVPRNLQKAEMTILDPDVCSQYIPFLLHPTQLCGFQTIGVGSSDGDAGAPLVLNNKLVGIASYIIPGAQGPEIFTNIYRYTNFIRYFMEVL